jgi:hypothetical protein
LVTHVLASLRSLLYLYHVHNRAAYIAFIGHEPEFVPSRSLEGHASRKLEKQLVGCETICHDRLTLSLPDFLFIVQPNQFQPNRVCALCVGDSNINGYWTAPDEREIRPEYPVEHSDQCDLVGPGFSDRFIGTNDRLHNWMWKIGSSTFRHCHWDADATGLRRDTQGPLKGVLRQPPDFLGGGAAGGL